MKRILVAIIAISAVLSGCEDEAEGAEASEATPASGETAEAEGATEEAPAPAADEGLTCTAYIEHMVELLSVQGDNAFIKADNQAEWIEMCEGADNLNDPEIEPVASCIMEAGDVEAVESCGNTRFMNRWATRQ